MLLIRRLRSVPRDGGSALVTVIAIAAVVAIVSVTMVATVSFATGTSARARAQVQAQASAEDAVDRTLSQMSLYTKGAETTFPCSLPYSEVTPAGSSSTEVTLRYRTEGGTAFNCPIPTSMPVVEAEVTATSDVSINTADGERTATRTVKQRLAVTDVPSGGSLFGYGIFSGSSFTATNTFNIQGGGLHANGDYGCNSSGAIIGPVSATGNVSITNGCIANSVAAGGTYTCSSAGSVTGDVTAAGAGTSSLTNGCKIGGTFRTKGPIQLTTATPRVGGNMISAAGGISASNTGPIVTGYGRAGGAITGAATMSTVFQGGYTANSPSAAPDAPPAEVMPAITWEDVQKAGWPVKNVSTWINESAAANNAPSWASGRAAGTCSADAANYGINGPMTSPAVPTVIDARTCDVNFQNIVLNLKDDLTIVVKSFSVNNSFRVSSTKNGAKLRIIVPVPAGATTCSATLPSSAKGTLDLKNSVTFDPNVDVLLYTNGKTSFTNTVNLHGSVYTCQLQASVATTIVHSDMTPPGMEGPSSALYAFDQTARYNLDPGDS
ncbi:hypothetical protein [Cellulomonas sp. Y8]|uniref:hypothetical protein n=1 Tax=Cellulomonas sp. Y8 TaxID=2591145 RepID=UPI0011CA4AFB|nr:hypothetical protein [Cellulomonas sp. Y8]